MSYANEETGSADVLWTVPDENGGVRHARAFAQAEHKFDEERKGYLRWSGTYFDMRMPSILRLCSFSNELDGQYDFVPARDHKASAGASLRWQNDNYIATTPYDGAMPGDPLNEYWASVFAIDRWQVSKRLVIEGQVRGEYYSGTQVDWAGRLTGLYSLDANGDHIVRLSAAKSYRSLAVPGQAKMSQTWPLPSPPFAPGLFWLNNEPLNDPDNEETWTIETGYRGKIWGPLSLRADGYYQRYEKLIGIDYWDDPNPPLPGFSRFFSGLRTLGGANAWGGEVELAAENKTGKASIWYAYQAMRPDQGDQQNMRACLPAPHKIGATGRLSLPHGFTLSANYRFSESASGVAIGALSYERSHRLDLNVAKKLGDNAELMLGVNDVLENHNPGAALATTSVLQHETPGRMLFLRFQIQF